ASGLRQQVSEVLRAAERAGWKNSNRSNPLQTINREHLLHEVDVEARSESSLSDLSAVHAPASHYE
ncbi:MAG: hypothetical protein WCB23_06540, partial [Pseudolabrys sp.]